MKTPLSLGGCSLDETGARKGMNDSAFQLDQEAARLFQELGGIDSREQEISPSAMDRLTGSLDEEEEQLDPYRILLVEMVHHLSAFLMGSYYWEGVRSATDTFDQLSNIFLRLRDMPNADKDLIIRYRGVPTGKGAFDQRYDYMVRFGLLQMDADIATSMIRRMGIRMSHISGRLSRAFQSFQKHGINNLHLRLPDRTPDSLKRLWTCLTIMPQYRSAAEKKTDIKLVIGEKTVFLGIVYDEHHQPDPNLTMTAALSRIKAASMQQLVNKVAAWMEQSGSRTEGTAYASVYEAIFKNKGLREKLVKPPLEVNNLKWLMVSHDQEVVPRSKARLASIVAQRFHDRPQVVSKMMDSVYGRDYGRISAAHVGERVQMSSELVGALGEKPQYRHTQGDVLSHVDRGFDHVRDSVFDQLQLEGDNVVINPKREDKRLKALTILTEDFLSDPSQISFSDRNAMMLCNMLLRKYNKELHLHIEITPEEVLRVKTGLDNEAAGAISAIIDQEQKPFLDKMRTIRKEITQGLVKDTQNDTAMPLRYLLFLTRELYVFLALVGGRSAHMVLRSAVKEYGNPESEIYHLKGSRHHMGLLLQHLTIALGGLGRIGRQQDLVLVKGIHEEREGFKKLGEAVKREDLFGRILGCAQECEAGISYGRS